jgi:hypothetical protein
MNENIEVVINGSNLEHLPPAVDLLADFFVNKLRDKDKEGPGPNILNLREESHQILFGIRRSTRRG